MRRIWKALVFAAIAVAVGAYAVTWLTLRGLR